MVEMLSREELKELSRLKVWRSNLGIFLDWSGILLSFLAVIFIPHPLTYILAFCLIARFQYGLAIMMHDGAHGRLFQNVGTNDRVGQWLLAAPLFFSMDSYRVLHLKHHRQPLTPEDPDLSLTGGYPSPKRKFYQRLLRDFVGISYLKFIKYFVYQSRHHQKKSVAPTSATHGTTKKKNERALSNKELFASMLVMNGLIFAFLLWLGHPAYYFVFWFLPMVSVLQVYLRIRGVSEHAGYAPNEDQSLNTRTIKPSWQTLVFAPHRVNYHIEHHLYTSIPYYHLSKVHKLMQERGGLPATNVFDSYSEVFAGILS